MRTYLERNEGRSFKGSEVLESRPELHNEKSRSKPQGLGRRDSKPELNHIFYKRLFLLLDFTPSSSAIISLSRAH